MINNIIAAIAPAITSMTIHDIPVGVVETGPGVGAETVVLQLVDALTFRSVIEVAVTFMIVDRPVAAQIGTVTSRVTSPEAPASRVSELVESFGDHPVPPWTLRLKVSVALPVFVTVTV